MEQILAFQIKKSAYSRTVQVVCIVIRDDEQKESKSQRTVPFCAEAVSWREY